MISPERIREIEAHRPRKATLELLAERKYLIEIAKKIADMKNQETWPEIILEKDLNALDGLHETWKESND